ncbi:MAG: YhgE/Pip domain-containing protein [Clostridiales bacterium]|nr:YhgE/Pip domain-containing protein [Clostridiales bacterium]
MSSAKELLNIGVSGMDKLMEILPNVKEKIDDITIKIDNINSNKNITDLIELIKNNVSERIDYLQNPVEIENVTMYPMGNYGSQMAPFYSVLASWVGLTFLISMFKVNTSGLEKSYEVYFGKMGLFMAISIIQGFIIALGDLYFLKINCKFPVLFIISMIITSIVFTIIVYTLVSVFANVGKVIAIILMILQVAGSGGTFPIQLTSNFFIKLNPYLPFTYAISLLRESIGGPVKEIILYDIFCLTIFSIIALLIGVILKKYINKVMNNFADVLEESNLVQ